MTEVAGGSPAEVVAEGRTLAMAAWKQIVADLASRAPDTPVRLVFDGGANQIAGYRLYYMLRYAKQAGLGDVTLESDGVFWIDEATIWLIESGVDRVVLKVRGALDPALEDRIRALEVTNRAAGRGPRVDVNRAT